MYDNFDEDFFLEDTYYTVGINGGVEFSKLLYDGKKSMFGRPQVAFVTEDSSTKITINPSYHAYTIEHGSITRKEKETDNGTSDNK